MDLGREQGIPVVCEPLSSAEVTMCKAEPHIRITFNSSDSLFETYPDMVEAFIGLTKIYQNRVATMIIPFYARRLATAKLKAARRILAIYSGEVQPTNYTGEQSTYRTSRQTL